MRKLQTQIDAGDPFFVHRRQQLHRDQHLVARLRVVEEHDGFQVFAQRHAPAIEVDDLRHRTVGIRAEAEPHARAGQVIAVQRLRNLDLAPEPDRFFWRCQPVMAVAVRIHLFPAAVVQRWLLTMRHIALVVSPLAPRQNVETLQPLDRGLLLGAKVQPW